MSSYLSVQDKNDQKKNNNELSVTTSSIKSLVGWADLKTPTAREWMTAKLNQVAQGSHHPGPTPIIKKYLKVSDDSVLQKSLDEFAELHPHLQKILEPREALEKESTGELVFLGEAFQPFNFIPFLLVVWSTLRVWIMPLAGMIMPLLILIIPYFVIRFLIGKADLTIGLYLQILKKMTMDSFSLSLPIPMSFGGAGGAGGKQSFLSFIGVAATIVQSIVQSYWSHKHLKSIDTILTAKGQHLKHFQELYERIYRRLKDAAGIELFRPVWLVQSGEGMKPTLASALLYPNQWRIYIQCLAEVEVWMALAKKVSGKEACLVQWLRGVPPMLRLTGAYDPDVPSGKRVPIDFEAGPRTSANYLLTGPNKGGKSTALRAITESLYMSHAFGIGLAKEAWMTPFGRISVCLTPDDLPGEMSRFEREVDFCRKTVRRGDRQIVLIDELFHSTNPPDAERASEVFTKKLWAIPNSLSVISTHLFRFVESAPPDIGLICCPATVCETTEDGAKKIVFNYGLCKGICEVSSVDTILKAAGMFYDC